MTDYDCRVVQAEALGAWTEAMDAYGECAERHRTLREFIKEVRE